MMVLAESLLSFKCMGVGGRVGEGGRGLSCSWAVSMFSFCVFEVA